MIRIFCFLMSDIKCGLEELIYMVRINRTINQQQVLALVGIVVKVVSTSFAFLPTEFVYLNTYRDLIPCGFLIVVCVLILF
jgi:hypothetical protein